MSLNITPKSKRKKMKKEWPVHHSQKYIWLVIISTIINLIFRPRDLESDCGASATHG